jgi:hypothetical protein
MIHQPSINEAESWVDSDERKAEVTMLKNPEYGAGGSMRSIKVKKSKK